MIINKRIRRKVCIPFGKWGDDTDFILEPVCDGCDEDGKECEICSDYIWIEEVKKSEKK